MAKVTEAYEVGLGHIILFKQAEKAYCPALVNRVNDDGSVNLTLFQRSGDTALATCVQKGDEVGKWCPTGVHTAPGGQEHPPPLNYGKEGASWNKEKFDMEDKSTKSTLGQGLKPTEMSKKE